MSVPIFVLGFQRSGTTLLQGLLGAHPDVAAAPETHYLFRIYDLRDFYGDLGEDRRLRRVVHDLLHPPIPLLADCGFDEARLLARIRRRGATYATVLDELLLDFAGRQGASRWSEKSPGQPAESVLELFPSAQLVHISRDPVDVIASSVSTRWNDRSMTELAEQWARFEQATARVARTLPPSQYLAVSYESLVRDPAASITALCAFLGLPERPEMTEQSRRRSSVASFTSGWLGRVADPIDSSSIGRGRSVLSPAQQAEIRRIAAAPVAAPAASPTSPLTPEQRYERTYRFFAELDSRCRA